MYILSRSCLGGSSWGEGRVHSVLVLSWQVLSWGEGRIHPVLIPSWEVLSGEEGGRVHPV